MGNCKKIKFLTEADAQAKLETILKKSTRNKKPIRVYKCFCNYWHLTSRLDVKDIQKENHELVVLVRNLKNQVKMLQERNAELTKAISKIKIIVNNKE